MHDTREIWRVWPNNVRHYLIPLCQRQALIASRLHLSSSCGAVSRPVTPTKSISKRPTSCICRGWYSQPGIVLQIAFYLQGFGSHRSMHVRGLLLLARSRTWNKQNVHNADTKVVLNLLIGKHETRDREKEKLQNNRSLNRVIRVISANNLWRSKITRTWCRLIIIG